MKTLPFLVCAVLAASSIQAAPVRSTARGQAQSVDTITPARPLVFSTSTNFPRGLTVGGATNFPGSPSSGFLRTTSTNLVVNTNRLNSLLTNRFNVNLTANTNRLNTLVTNATRSSAARTSSGLIGPVFPRPAETPPLTPTGRPTGGGFIAPGGFTNFPGAFSTNTSAIAPIEVPGSSVPAPAVTPPLTPPTGPATPGPATPATPPSAPSAAPGGINPAPGTSAPLAPPTGLTPPQPVAPPAPRGAGR